MEINDIRPYFVRAMGVITHLHREAQPEPDENAMDFA